MRDYIPNPHDSSERLYAVRVKPWMNPPYWEAFRMIPGMEVPKELYACGGIQTSETTYLIWAHEASQAIQHAKDMEPQ